MSGSRENVLDNLLQQASAAGRGASAPSVPNYLPNIQSPFQAAVQGLQLGQAFGEAAGETQRRASLQSAMQAFQRDPSSRTLTPLLTALPPQSAEQLRKHYEGMGAERRQETIGFGGQMFSLIMSGRTDLAKELATTRGAAARNAGDQANADLMDRVAQLVEVNPAAARDLLAVSIGATEEGRRAIDSVFAARGAPTAERTAVAGARQAEATATTTEAQAGVAPEAAAAEAARKRAEVEKIYAEISDKQGEIPESARTIVNQSADALFAARSRAQNAASLSERFRNAWQDGNGLFTRAGDALGDAFGSQSEQRQVRQDFERLRTSEIVKNLPPGPATDRDIEIISRGFPPPTADVETIKAFLSSVERVAKYDEAYQDARGQWAAANGQLGPSRRDFTIDGIQVPRGTTFANFAREYLGAVQDRIAGQEAESLARSRNYGRVLQGPGQ